MSHRVLKFILKTAVVFAVVFFAYSGVLSFHKSNSPLALKTAFAACSSTKTNLATSTDASSATIAPGAATTTAASFDFQATGNGSCASLTDSLTDLTVSLAASGNATSGLANVSIWNSGNTTMYFNATTTFYGTNTIKFTGGTALPVTNTNVTFNIRILPLSHANMPAVPGASYAISATVTNWTGTLTHAGNDGNANTQTIDNLSPNAATSLSATAGNALATLGWTASNSSDISQSVILRWASGSVGSEVPAEGTSYSTSTTISTATVACVFTDTASQARSAIVDGTGATSGCTTSALTNSQAYSYKIFTKDTSGNYDAGSTIGTVTPVAVTIAGTAYTDDGGGTGVNAKTIIVLINGAATTTVVTNASGVWTATPAGTWTTGDIITAYISGDSTKGITIDRASSTSLTSVNIYGSVVRTMSDDGSNVTTANFDTADNNLGSADQMYTVSGNNLTVTAGYKLRIGTGSTYAPIGNVTVDALEILGTYNDGANTTTLRKGGTSTTCTGAIDTVMPLCINGGTLTASTTTYSFQATSTNALVAQTTYYNLTLAPSGSGSPTFTFQSGTTTVSNNMQIGDGTNTGTASTTPNNPNIAITGSLTVNASGTFNGAGTGNIIVSGGASGAGTVNLTGGLFELRGTQNLNNSAAWTFNNLNIGNGAAASITSVNTATVTVSSILTIGSTSTLNAGVKSFIISANGSSLVNNGTFTASTSLVSFQATSGTTSVPSLTYYNLNFSPSSGSPEYRLATSTLTVNNNLTMSGGTAPLINANASNTPVTITGNLTIASGWEYKFQTSGTMTLSGNFTNNGTFTMTGATFLVGGSWANNGTFTAGSSVDGFTATSGTKTITGTTAFGTLNIQGNGGTFDTTTASITATSISVSTGATLTGSSTIITTGGATGAGTINMTGGTFELRGTQNLGGTNTTGWTFKNLNIGTGATANITSTGTATITVSSLLAIGSSSTLNAGNRTWILSAGGLPLVSSGTFTASTSTFSFQGLATTTIPSNISFYNLDVAPASGTHKFFAGNWYNNVWAYRKAITIDKTKVSTASSTNLSNFPVLVNITDSNLSSSASSTGADILFTKADGTTKLNHEIETYASSTGALVAWVQVPLVSTSTDTTIYMYYGNTATTSQQNATGVWDSNYAVVQHLPNGTTLTANDSTSNANNGTITSTTATTGQVDGSGSFTGTSSYISIPISNSFSSSTALTLSAWINTATTTAQQAIISRWGSTNSFSLILNSGATNRVSLLVSTTGSGSTEHVNGVVLGDGNWHYVSATYDGAIQKMYIDGAVSPTTTAANGTIQKGPAGEDLRIGYDPDGFGSDYFSGKIDEARVSVNARSNDWIITEYNNQNSPSTFYSVGPQAASSSATTTMTVSNNFTTTGAGSPTVDFSAMANLTVGGTVSIGSGDAFTAPTSTVVVAGGAVTGDGTITHTSGTFQIDGSGNFGGTSAWTFNNLSLGTATTSTTTSASGGAVTVAGTLTVGASSVLNAGTKTWTLNGSSTPLILSGTLTASTSTFSFQGLATTTIPSASFYNLDVAPSSGSAKFLLGNWYSSSWLYRKAITIDHTKIASSTAANLTNFPVLVSLGSDSNLSANASSSGADILFTGGDGISKLNHEIETYASSSGALIAWVKVPLLATSTDTTLYMYYGNTSAASQQNASGVWDSNYKLVWHLPNGTALTTNDSTSYGNNGSVTGTVTAASGEIGGGASMALSQNNHYISAATSTSGLGITNLGTFSGWISASNLANTGYVMSDFNANGNGMTLRINNGGSSDFYVYPNNHRVTATYSFSTSTMYSLAGVMDGTNVYLYINGSLAGQTTLGENIGAGNNLVLARRGDLSDAGAEAVILDEIRVSKINRSADWIKTEYNNQSATSTFYTIGSQQTTSSAVTITNNLTSSGGTETIDANTFDPLVSVTGNATIGTGVIYSASNVSTTTLSGNLTINGSFTHNSGVLAFTPTATSTITSAANVTFNNVTITSAGKGLQFQKATANVPTFTFAGAFIVTGQSGSLITIQSDTAASQWLVNFSGAQSAITYAYIKDSGCAGGSASVTNNNNTNGGNNGTCWFAVAAVSLGGGGFVFAPGDGSGGGTLVTGGGSGGGSGGSAGGTESGSGGGTGQTGGGSGGGGGASP